MQNYSTGSAHIEADALLTSVLADELAEVDGFTASQLNALLILPPAGLNE